MQTPDLLTPRLRLIAITPEHLHAESIDPHNLAPLLHTRIPADWEPVLLKGTASAVP